jgi:hypothetical protein
MHGELDKFFDVEPLTFPYYDSSGIGSGRRGSKVLYCSAM